MAWISLFLYIAGAMTAFHHIHEAQNGAHTVSSTTVGVIAWPIFWPVMYAVVFVGTLPKRAV